MKNLAALIPLTTNLGAPGQRLHSLVPEETSIHRDMPYPQVAYYEAPGTAHQIQTWRKSLHGFAQLLFNG